jgi:hypothetical protein
MSVAAKHQNCYSATPFSYLFSRTRRGLWINVSANLIPITAKRGAATPETTKFVPRPVNQPGPCASADHRRTNQHDRRDRHNRRHRLHENAGQRHRRAARRRSHARESRCQGEPAFPKVVVNGCGSVEPSNSVHTDGFVCSADATEIDLAEYCREPDANSNDQTRRKAVPPGRSESTATS